MEKGRENKKTLKIRKKTPLSFQYPEDRAYK